MLQWDHSAILLTFIKPPFVIKIFVLSIYEWWFYTGFTVFSLFSGVQGTHIVKTKIPNFYDVPRMELSLTLTPPLYFVLKMLSAFMYAAYI